MTSLQKAIDATIVSVPPGVSVPVATRHYDISPGVSKDLTEETINALKKQGFSEGLAKSLSQTNTNFPLRIWLIDNSGSMQKVDGHRIIPITSGMKNELKILDCSRWDEISESVKYHVDLAALLEAPTSFRLLNNPGVTVGPQQFDIGLLGPTMISAEKSKAKEIMSKARPGGATSLTKHIEEIHATVKAVAPTLNAEGKKVAVVIATDGLPTDSCGNAGKEMRDEFIKTLRSLEGLPVWLVIRLCTDNDDVVRFYNSLDKILELSMDVLDDFVGEAEQIYQHNKWLTYGLPLHRMREMGFHNRIFDMLDERPLTLAEIREFCRLLFGLKDVDELPDPAIDWKSFLTKVDMHLRKEELQYHPVKKRMMPWISLAKLHKIYGDEESCIVM